MPIEKIQLHNPISKLESRNKTPINQQNPEDTPSDTIKNKAAKLMIGATALAGLVALGISGYRGKLGKTVQKMMGGAEKAMKPNPEAELAAREAERAAREAQERINAESERILKELEDEPKRAKKALELSNARNEEWLQQQHNLKEKEYEKMWLNAEKEQKLALAQKHQQEINDIINTDLSTKSEKELNQFYDMLSSRINALYKEGVEPDVIKRKSKYFERLTPAESEYKKLAEKRAKIWPELNERRNKLLETLLVKPTDKQVMAERGETYLWDEARGAIGRYYDNYPYNSKLRNGVDPSTIEDVVIMDKAFTEAPALQKDAVVYRAMFGHPIFKDNFKFVNSIKQGDVIKDASFISTSVNATNAQFRQFANNAMEEGNAGLLMRIKLPKGTKGILGGYDEYLLPRNSQIKINKIEIVDGHKIADCEYILP